MSDQASTPQVYAAISRAMALLKASGIAKAQWNGAQKFNYRGIDDIHNALAPVLVESGLLMLPRVKSRTCVERKSSMGNALYFVTVEADFDLISVADGSTVTISVIGEAMDSADKATNKAMSVAYKYAAVQAFSIPVVGDGGDPEADDAPDNGSTFSIWSAQHKSEASAASEMGLKSYTDWWRAQSQTWRDSAINSLEHGEFKARAVASSASKRAAAQANVDAHPAEGGQ